MALQNDTAGFLKLAELLKSLTGINMPQNDKNLSLMASRLSSVLRERRLTTYKEYLAYLDANGGEAITEFVCSLTTNTTEFFREAKHFDTLKEVLPQLLKSKVTSGNKELRVWCAATSTGQEPYTIAVTLSEAVPDLMMWNVKFLATDIDMEVLQKAADASYSEADMRTLPPLYRQKYFVHQNAKGRWAVRDEMRKMISFAQFNLLTPQYPFKHKFDIIFCRNVLIYFDRETCAKVIDKLIDSLNPGGYLFVGHAESGMVKSDKIKTVAVAAYQRVGKVYK